jgi:hypothetical protein
VPDEDFEPEGDDLDDDGQDDEPDTDLRRRRRARRRRRTESGAPVEESAAIASFGNQALDSDLSDYEPTLGGSGVW